MEQNRMKENKYQSYLEPQIVKRWGRGIPITYLYSNYDSLCFTKMKAIRNIISLPTEKVMNLKN